MLATAIADTLTHTIHFAPISTRTDVEVHLFLVLSPTVTIVRSTGCRELGSKVAGGRPLGVRCCLNLPVTFTPAKSNHIYPLTISKVPQDKMQKVALLFPSPEV